VMDAQTQRVLMNFQMRYRPTRYDGQMDAESAAILEVLTTPAPDTTRALPASPFTPPPSPFLRPAAPAAPMPPALPTVPPLPAAPASAASGASPY
jgi:N-acetylmuramoyl-L-alanine amidase